jgi:hypothetical protein
MNRIPPKDISGNILFWKIPGFFRLTSRVFVAVEILDFENGYDAIIPDTVSDEELGLHIRRCFERSKRFSSHSELPKIPQKTLNQDYKSWEKELLKKMKRPKMSGFSVGEFKTLNALKSSEQYYFSNCSCRENPSVPREILPHQEGFQNFTLPITASHKELGALARSAFDACLI